jgi:hypothetical protein
VQHVQNTDVSTGNNMMRCRLIACGACCIAAFVDVGCIILALGACLEQRLPSHCWHRVFGQECAILVLCGREAALSEFEFAMAL